MGGSLLQLVAKGMQDIYILGDPQITLFRMVYRRSTNFSMYDKIITPSGSGNFSSQFTLKFDPLGDLLHKMWLMVDIPDIQLKKNKSTFAHISNILTSFGVTWDYSPEDSKSNVTLDCYNGNASYNVSIFDTGTIETGTIETNAIQTNDTTITLKKGYLTLSNGNKVKITGGNLVVNTTSTPINSTIHTPLQVDISSGTIYLSNDSVFGNALPITSGTVTISVFSNLLTNPSGTLSVVNLTAAFTNSIRSAINSEIEKIALVHNFYTNAYIMTRNSDYIINKSVDVFSKLNINTVQYDNTTITNIRNSMISGRNLFMYLMQLFHTKYMKTYAYDGLSQTIPLESNDYLVATDNTGLTFRDPPIQIFSSDRRDFLIAYGLMFGAILNYAYDAVVYNTNGDSATHIDNFASSPLFGTTLPARSTINVLNNGIQLGTIHTNVISLHATTITLKSGPLYLPNGSTATIIGGVLNLSSEIDSILSVPLTVNVSSGTIILSSYYDFGNTLSIISGTVRISSFTNLGATEGAIDRVDLIDAGKSKLVKLRLYNSDDIRTLIYITFINNLVRLKIVPDQGSLEDFNPLYATILKTSNINVSLDNLSSLDPDTVAIDDVILFYHTIDADIIKYVVYQYNIGENTNVYFDNNIGSSYSIFEKYNKEIPVNRGSFKDTDSYKIYRSYMQDVISNDAVNRTIKSIQQVSLIANIIKYNIDSNIRYNFGQVTNNISILTKATRTQSDHYILSFYKTFTSSTGGFTTTAGASFTPVIDSSSPLLKDNFKTIINSLVNIQVPEGVSVTNYYNNYIQTQIKVFITSIQGQLRSTNYDSYMGDFKIWERLLFTSGSSILMAYSTGLVGVSNVPYPDATTFGRIALMNFIPLLAAKDIPKLVYNMFVTYAKEILVDNLGADSSHYDNFMLAVDMRDFDSFDGPTSGRTETAETTETKKEIYKALIDALFVTTYDGSTKVIDNAAFFNELQTERANSTNYLLSCALRPDTFFAPYSTQHTDGSGTLVPLSTSPADLKYLPIEWLTQTYYHILSNKIDTMMESAAASLLLAGISAPQQLIAINALKGVLANIINSFIVRNNMPSYDDYTNNDYLILGLNVETNSTLQNYKKPDVVNKATTSSYCDAISSIWYQSQKSVIQLYNQLYNDTLVSQDYYANNLGKSMGAIYTYIKSQIIGNDELNPYYDKNNLYYDMASPYQYFIPDSLFDIFIDLYGPLFRTLLSSANIRTDPDIRASVLAYVKELYPPIDTNNNKSGFDFYRLSGMGNVATQGTKSYRISTYIKDYSALYTYILSYYNAYKSITLIKNDNDSIIKTTNVSPLTTMTLRKDFYAYETANTLAGYFRDHINRKYISIPTVTDQTIRDTLTLLNVNATTYWNPDVYSSDVYVGRNENGVYGVLDALYNSHLEGNIVTTLNKIDTIPNNKISTDPVDFTQVPFTSFCLHDWYLNLSSFTGIKYALLGSVKDIFKATVFKSDGVTPLLTSQSISANQNLKKLYSDSNNNIFTSVDMIAWLLYDTILENIVKNDPSISKNFDINSMKYIIVKSSNPFNSSLFVNNTTNIINDNGAIETLTQFVSRYVLTGLIDVNVQLNTITNFKRESVTEFINSLYQFYNIKNGSSTDDLNFYGITSDGTYLSTASNLQSRLLNLINTTVPKFAWTKELGHKIAKRLSISIGGQIIETYTPELMHLVYQMNKCTEQERGYNILIGNTEEMYTLSEQPRTIKTLYVPLYFWCCKNAGNSVPMLNLMFSDITLSGIISDMSDLLYTDVDTFFTKPPKIKCRVLARYIYLDDEERTRIAGSKMEYLIEKFNFVETHTFSQNNLFEIGGSVVTIDNNNLDFEDFQPKAIINLHITDPIKYFVWYMKFRDKTTEETVDVLNWNTFGYNVRNSGGTMETIKNIVSTITIKMNGVIREVAHDEIFFTHLVPYSKAVSSLDYGEYMYSFALFPLILQPTGSANYSEIPDSSIEITFTQEIINKLKSNPNLELKIESWGQSMNILRFVSGMAGPVFVKP